MTQELKRIGANMATVMFNLAQREGEPITTALAATMSKLRNEWDAAYGATPSTSPASDAELPATWESLTKFREGGYCETSEAMAAMQVEIKAWRERAASTRTASEAECEYSVYSSRVCEQGTKGCTTTHRTASDTRTAAGSANSRDKESA